MVSVEKKLIEYLKMITKDTPENYITSSEIETEVPSWVRNTFGDTHNGSTFGRAWRKLRETHKIHINGDMDVMGYADISPVTINVKLNNKPTSREYRWKIHRM
tara:strand:- start:509 stop:817 length:309 start_codon:yes stop_codon:yes gene_type:complete